MTKLMQKAVETISILPEDRQDELARMLIHAAVQGANPYVLTAEERSAVEGGLAEARRGEFASDQEVDAVYAKYGV